MISSVNVARSMWLTKPSSGNHQYPHCHPFQHHCKNNRKDEDWCSSDLLAKIRHIGKSTSKSVRDDLVRFYQFVQLGQRVNAIITVLLFIGQSFFLRTSGRRPWRTSTGTNLSIFCFTRLWELFVLLQEKAKWLKILMKEKSTELLSLNVLINLISAISTIKTKKSISIQILNSLDFLFFLFIINSTSSQILSTAHK